MDNQDLIADHYRNMTDGELLALVQTPASLTPEAVVLLQKELLQRGKQQEAISLTEFLAGKAQNAAPDLDTEIAGRIASGETVESIRIDMRDRGIDITDSIGSLEKKKVDNQFEYIIELRAQGLSEAAVYEKLEEQFGTTEDENAILIARLKKRSITNLAVGIGLIVLCGGFLLAAIGNGFSPGIGAIVLIGIGCQRLFKGIRQSR